MLAGCLLLGVVRAHLVRSILVKDVIVIVLERGKSILWLFEAGFTHALQLTVEVRRQTKRVHPPCHVQEITQVATRILPIVLPGSLREVE